MKKDTALKLGLMLLGILLSLGPLIISLGTHNWDIVAAVMPSDAELNQTQNLVTGLIDNQGFTADTFSLGSPTIQGNTIRVPAQFTSPFKIPITLESLTISVSDQGATIAQLRTESSVEIPAQGTVSITFVGTYTGTTLPTNPQISGIDNMTIEVYGITISARLSSVPGG